MSYPVEGMVGAPLIIEGLTGGNAYALGPTYRGALFYVIVGTYGGVSAPYRANDQTGTMPTLDQSGDRAYWSMDQNMIHALYQSAIREYANRDAEDQRYTETVTLRERLARMVTDREAIMHEMMERAAEAADEAGFCPEYDRLAEALGYEGRSRDWTVTVEIESFTVTIPITARNEQEARDEIVESMVDDAIRQHIGYTSISWSIDDVERA